MISLNPFRRIRRTSIADTLKFEFSKITANPGDLFVFRYDPGSLSEERFGELLFVIEKLSKDHGGLHFLLLPNGFDIERIPNEQVEQIFRFRKAIGAA